MNVRFFFSRLRVIASLSLAALLLAAAVAPARLGAADVQTPPAATDSENAPAPQPPPPAIEPETPRAPAAPAPLPSVTRGRNRGDFVTIGNNAELRKNERAGDMVTIMGNAMVDGELHGDSVTVMGNVVLHGTVDGDLVCVLGEVAIGPGAEIHGDVVGIGGKISIDPSARVEGDVVPLPFFGGLSLPAVKWVNEWIHDGLLWGRVLPHNHPWAWGAAVVFLLINLLFAAIFRRPVEAAASNLERKPVMSFIAGLFVLVLVGPIVTLLSITVVGLLVVPFIAAGMFIAWYSGTIAVYRYSAAQLGLRAHPLLAVLAGNVLFVLLYAVPVLGFAVWSVTGLIGLGAAMLTFREGMRRESVPTKKETPSSPRSTSTTQQQQQQQQTADVAPSQVVTASPEAREAQVSGLASEVATSVPENQADEVSSASVPPTPPPLSVPPLPRRLAIDTLERAGLWPRLAALALDFLMIGAVYLFLPWFVRHIPYFFPLMFLAYHIAFWSWRGTTPGGLVMNLRVERLDGGAMTPGVAAVRALAGIFSLIPGGLGFWWTAWDEARQSWHDKIAGTIVVRVTRAESFV